MPGPIDSLRFVHAAILREADDLEQAINDAASPAEAGALADRIDYFGQLVHSHTSGEEVGMFPPLVERDAALAETYLVDHEDERALFAELVSLAKSCQSGDTAALDRMRRQIVALVTHAHSHVGKENELVLPRIASTFSPEEQGQMVGAILATFSQEETAKAIPWIIDRLDVPNSAAYVGVLSNAMPPPAFEAAKGWIRDGIDPDHYAALAEAAPVLTS